MSEDLFIENPAAYGDRFDLNPYPTAGGLVEAAYVTNAQDVAKKAPAKETRWSIIAEVTEFPDDSDPDQQIVGPTLGVELRAGDAGMKGPRQLVLVPALGVVIPASGRHIEAKLLAKPKATALQALIGTLQIRRGHPRPFEELQTITIPVAGAVTVDLPPFASWYRYVTTVNTANVTMDFNPSAGGKVVSVLPNNSASIRNTCPIPRAATSITVTNATTVIVAAMFTFGGYA